MRPWRLVALGVAVAVIAGIVGIFAVVWYYADQVNNGAFVVNHDAPRLNLRVISVTGSQVVLERASDDSDEGHLRDPGVIGLEWSGGYARVGEILQQDDSSITRRFEAPWGEVPSAGDLARLDSFAYPPDPRLALGVSYQNVTFASALGFLPAWYVPGARDTWVLFVHGKGSSRAESLRLLKVTSTEGFPGLAMTYRNDVGAPSSLSGRYDYGASEWEDVEGAVIYARNAGARQVVLVGYSMGGGIVMSFMQCSEQAAAVSGLILDAPMLCFECLIDYQAQRRNLPSPLTSLAKVVISERFDLDWAALDYRPLADTLQVPTLIFHGDADTTVPVSASRDFADAGSRFVQRHEFEDAWHVGSWNLHPELYERLVREFLEQVAPK